MTIERKIADLFRLNDEARNRHAHPWSVISRSIVLPILIIAFWSRLWLGYWAIIPVILALVWTWLTQRSSLPRIHLTIDHTIAVLGERIWMNRDKRPVPVHHRNAPKIF